MFHMRFVLDELKLVAKNNERRIQQYAYFMFFYHPYKHYIAYFATIVFIVVLHHVPIAYSLEDLSHCG